MLACLCLGTGAGLPQSDLIITTKFPERAPANRQFDVQVELENLSSQALRVVGVDNCWGDNCVFQLESSIPMTLQAKSSSTILFSVETAKPGNFSFLLTLFFDRNGHLERRQVPLHGQACLVDWRLFSCVSPHAVEQQKIQRSRDVKFTRLIARRFSETAVNLNCLLRVDLVDQNRIACSINRF